jgi:hypothetical protein
MSTFVGKARPSIGDVQVARTLEGSKSMPQFPLTSKKKSFGQHKNVRTSRKRGRQSGMLKSQPVSRTPKNHSVRNAWGDSTIEENNDVLIYFNFSALSQDGPKSSRGKERSTLTKMDRPSTVSYARYDILPILTNTGETPFEIGLNSGTGHVLPVFQLPQVTNLESKLIRKIDSSITNQVCNGLFLSKHKLFFICFPNLCR